MVRQVLTVPYIALSLNEYRNKNHFTLNDLKQVWNDRIAELVLVQGIQPAKHPVIMTYTFSFDTNTRRDADNCCITPKFCADSLVKCGILKDDSFDEVLELRIRRGPKAKAKYVEILIEEVYDGPYKEG